MVQGDPQPSRPPRGSGRSTKDPSSGILMSVIRALTASRDTSEREKERHYLEKEYKESDERLEKLVLHHHQDLSVVLQTFSKISGRLKTAKERVHGVREKLQLSQKLLHCKRDELKKLWLESIENKYVLDLLDQVEKLMKVPSEVSDYVQKKHYLHATNLLVKSVKTLNRDLGKVEALREVKTELTTKKDDMYEILVDDLHKHVYVRSTQEVIKKLKRTASERRQHMDTPIRKASVADILSPAAQQGSALSKRKGSSTTGLNSDGELEEDLNVADPEEDSRHFTAIILECLALLNKLPEAIDTILGRCDSELINIIKRTGKEILGEAKQQGSTAHGVLGANIVPTVLKSSDDQSQAILLQEFLELLFQQFRAVVHIHENVILPNLKRIQKQYDIPFEIYSMVDIWSKIQSVLQLVQDLYLDMSAPSSSGPEKLETNAQSSLDGNPQPDFSSYFMKKRLLNMPVTGTSFASRAKKNPLFRFDQSSHAMSLNAYLQEQKDAMNDQNENQDADKTDDDQYIVCKPAPENLAIMFEPMNKFMKEIEDELSAIKIDGNALEPPGPRLV